MATKSVCPYNIRLYVPYNIRLYVGAIPCGCPSYKEGNHKGLPMPIVMVGAIPCGCLVTNFHVVSVNAIFILINQRL